MNNFIFADIASMIRNCPCENGCPSCVGPAAEVGTRGKKIALDLSERLIDE